MPTQIGFDSDDAMAAGEVGKVGVPISCLDDFDELLLDIPLEDPSRVRLTTGMLGSAVPE